MFQCCDAITASIAQRQVMKTIPLHYSLFDLCFSDQPRRKKKKQFCPGIGTSKG